MKRVLGFLVIGGAVAALGCQGAGGGGPEAGPLASGQSGVQALAVNGAYVYWTMVSIGSLRRVSIDGGKVETVADGIHTPDQLVVDDSDVYLSTLAGEIVRVDKTGGKPKTIAEGQNDVVGLELDDVFVYWATRDGQVRRLPKNGGGAAALLATAPQGLTAIAEQSGQVYWTAGVTDNGVLDSISANGGAPVATLVQGLGSPRQLVVAPTSAFWVATNIDNVDPMTGMTTTTTGISGAGLDGSDVRTISSDAGNVTALVGDDTTLFVAAGPPKDTIAFSAISATGGAEPINFANGPAGTASLALDETSIYWTSSGDGNIFSLPKSETQSP